MNNLINIGLTNETIEKLINEYEEPFVDGINNNIDNTSKIFDLIKAFGIENINDYILNHFDIFLLKYKDIKNLIMQADLDNLKREIIEDNDYLAEYIMDNI